MIKQDSLSFKILDALWNVAALLPVPLESPYAWKRRVDRFDPHARSSYFALRRLKRNGLIKNVEKKGKKFIELTKQGKLEILFAKAKLPNQKEWDKKWRLVIFDIPESARKLRDNFRRLLYLNGFTKLQQSVFICPYPLNQAAVDYLKEAQLYDYIRIIRVDKLDNDADLRKKFNL